MIEFFKEDDTISRNNFNKVLTSVAQTQNNLIINSDFKIWQRGNEFQLNTSSYTYTSDRWKAKGTGKIIKDDKGLKVINGTARIIYAMELDDYSPLVGKPITLSWSKNGIINNTTRQPSYHTNEVFNITLDENDILNWVRLSIGEIALPYIPTVYAEEFNKCQRYYRQSTFMYAGFLSPDGNTAMLWGLPNNNMRIAPRVSVKSLNNNIAGKVDLIKGYSSGNLTEPFVVMSNAGVSRVILILPIGFNGMQGVLIEDAEIY